MRWRRSGSPPFCPSLFTLNLLLFVFNLIPVPPLDGSGAVSLLLQEDTARRFQLALRQRPALGLVGLVVAWFFFGEIFRPIWSGAVGLLYAGL